MAGELTTDNYWDSTYVFRGGVRPVSLDGYKSHCAKLIYSKKRPYVEAASSILEIGGGGSQWLAYLAPEFPSKEFVSLDFSKKGNALLSDYAKANELKNLSVEEGDFFSANMGGKKFDFVYSHGVVEHFEDLSSVLLGHSRFLSPTGAMLTIIPNMAGILGWLTKKMNKSVYDIHVPHDLGSFKKGHDDAGLRLVDFGYLCSSNFGVLSSCFKNQKSAGYRLYKQLTRVSKAVWWFEERSFELPRSGLFSPYIFAVSKRG